MCCCLCVYVTSSGSISFWCFIFFVHLFAATATTASSSFPALNFIFFLFFVFFFASTHWRTVNVSIFFGVRKTIYVLGDERAPTCELTFQLSNIRTAHKPFDCQIVSYPTVLLVRWESLQTPHLTEQTIQVCQVANRRISPIRFFIVFEKNVCYLNFVLNTKT